MAASVISTSTALFFPVALIIVLWPLGLTGIWLNFAATALLAGLLLCFVCAGRKARAIGRAVFAFGLLFEGIADMGIAMEPLA